ncbi:MAG: ABC transporter permease [Chitinivibrionales bacterium]|nr:ABC transporter permease [Chitinivibrionales bacterium]
MTRLQTMIWKEFTQIRADSLTLRLMIAPILIQLFILAYALTTEVKNTPVAVLDRCNTPQSADLSAHLRASPLMRFKPAAQTEEELRERIDRGDIKVGVTIPTDFSQKIDRSEGAVVQLTIDGQDANAAAIASGYLQAIIQSWSQAHLKKRLAAQGIRLEQMLPLSIREPILFNPLLKPTWYMVPGLAVLLVTMITALLTGFSIVKEKERGTLEQLMVTPLRPLEVVMGKTIPFAVIGLLELCVLMVFAMLWFKIPFRGSFMTLLIYAIIYMFSSLGLGVLTSTIARTPQQVMFLTFFILIFFLLLSGFFIPIENMPPIVQKITYINPVRYFMFIIRDVLLKGSSFADLWYQGAPLLLIGILYFTGATLAFNRKVG